MAIGIPCGLRQGWQDFSQDDIVFRCPLEEPTHNPQEGFSFVTRNRDCTAPFYEVPRDLLFPIYESDKDAI